MNPERLLRVVLKQMRFHFTAAKSSKMQSVRFAGALLFALGLIPLHTANAQSRVASAPVTVKKLVYHGAIENLEAPLDYQVFNDSLFFSAQDRLLRLDGVDGALIDQPLPVELSRGINLGSTFAAFDGALFFHAGREDSGSRQTFLYRLTSIDALPQWIDVPDDPEIEDYWGVEPGYPDATKGFATFNNALYFFANGANPGNNTWDIKLQPALFRLDSRAATPALTGWNSSRLLYFDVTLESAPDGLLVVANAPGVRGPGRYDHTWITLLDPEVEPPAGSRSVPLLYNNLFSVRDDSYGVGGALFDGSFFFEGKFVPGAGTGGIGPFAATRAPAVGRPGSPYWDTELYRYAIEVRRMSWYSINQTASDSYPFSCERGRPCGSFPRDFLATDDALYFQASSDSSDESLEMYRLSSAKGLPEIVPLNPNGASLGRPIDEIDDRLWFAADIGAGFDLHVMDRDGVTPIAVNVGEAVARSARAFTAYQNRVVFAAQDDNSDWWTFAVDLGQDDSGSKPFEASVTINGTAQPTAPGLQIATGSWISVACEVRNNTDRVLSPVRVRVRDLRKLRHNARQGGGKPGTAWRAVRGRRKAANCNTSRLLPGETANCQLTKTLGPGTHRFQCTATAGTKKKKSKNVPAAIRARAAAYATGQKIGKGGPLVNVGSVTVVEGQTASVPIRLSRPTVSPVTAIVETRDGSATEGNDYNGVIRRVEFAPGETETSIDVFSWDDIQIEETKLYHVVVREIINARRGTAGVVTIEDDDLPVISLQPASFTISETNDDQFVDLTLSLNQPSPETVSVSITSEAFEAEPNSDYVAFSERVVFPAGSVSQTVRLKIDTIDDDAPESDESFLIVLSDPASNAVIEQPGGSVTIIIRDDDPAEVTVVARPIGEGNAEFGTFFFLVVRGFHEAPVSFDVSTQDISAEAGSDYVPVINKRVTFPGDSGAFPIEIIDDSIIDANFEQIGIVLSNPSDNLSIGDPAAYSPLFIVDNDGPTRIEFGPDGLGSRRQPVEGRRDDSTFVGIYRIGASDEPVTVDVSTVDGSAKAGEDYNAVSETLTFGANIPGIPENFEFRAATTVVDDLNSETAETFRFQLSNPSANASLGGNRVRPFPDR